ncbi:MAG: response regulator [Fibromonadaceae bacterium]|jgi:signal transduction histidine kinase/CheY-like chemotaxis protein|nr:response regulator [Fibromonadaceae bacterium]
MKRLTLFLFTFSFAVVCAALFFANKFVDFSLNIMKENIERHSIAVAKHLVDMVSVDELDKYREKSDMQTPAYQNLREKLRDFAKESDVAYVYFIRPEENYLQYIIDNDFNDSTRVGLDTPPISYEKLPLLKDVKNQGKALYTGLGNYEVDWDGLSTAYAPMYDKKGNLKAIVGVDIEDKHIVYAEQMVFKLITLQIISVIIVFISGLLGIISFRNEARIAEKAKINAINANASKSKFLATISHEIRTPMNAIIGFSEIELLKEETPTEIKNTFRKIHNSGYMLLGIINDILDLSKIETGKFEIVPINYDTASLINDTVQLNLMRIGSKPIEFTLKVAENLPAKLFGDELRIKQILNNLLSNAIKYTKEGQVNVSFALAPRDKETINLVITVSDTGQGMTKEQVEHLFDEYSRFNMELNRTVEGTGLGMSITKRLVEMMDGKIIIESEPGKGSVFTVRVAQTLTGSEALGKELAENLQSLRFSGESQLKEIQKVREYMPYGSVLVVDDVETNLTVAMGLMAPYGLKIELLASGIEALEKIKEGNVYDIVFMDHMMPEMDGIETTKKIRETGYTKPIIALTANAVAGQANMFLQNGFDDFISKPIDIRQLNKVLKTWVRDKAAPELVEKAKQEQGTSKDIIPQIKTDLLGVFAKDTKKILPVIESTLENIAKATEEDLRGFTIKVHAMKSALANINEKETSNLAAELEKAGKEQNKNKIEAETPAFLAKLKDIIAKIDEAANDPGADADEDPAYLQEQLQIISTACEVYDVESIETALENLKKMRWTKETKVLIDKISEYLLFSDFEAVSKLCFGKI